MCSLESGAIDVRIEAGYRDLRATATGKKSLRLTNIYSTLGLNEDSVLRAIRKLDKSRQYNAFFFACMQKHLTPVSEELEILDDYNEPLIMTTRTFRNNSSKKGTYNTRLTYNESDTVSVSWSQSEQTDKDFELGFNIKLTGKAAIKFSNTVGEGEQRSKTVTLGTESGVNVELLPGEKILATLKATRRILKLKVDYEVTYSGDVVGTCVDHCNYTFDLNDFLKVAKRPRRHSLSEIIYIKYFIDDDIELSDIYS